MDVPYILVAYAFPLCGFICGGVLRFFGSEDVTDDASLREFGIGIMLGSVSFALMVHSPNLNGG